MIAALHKRSNAGYWGIMLNHAWYNYELSLFFFFSYTRLDSDQHEQYLTIIPWARVGYRILYNNQINARALIGQSAVVYCAGKPTEKSRVFWIII